MDWKHHLDETSANLADYRKTHEAAGRGFTAMHRGAMGEGSLTLREKELIALAIGIAQRCVDCIGFHVQAAAKAGATRDDVADVIGVATLMGGGPAYMYGVKALEAYDQLIGEP
ncbi:carboxymuconolactone decarboxylase family protein [Psychromarinibacter sp. S121]|uniref:carboxymuconolactone decarboxylase family protein n=1 Tax=Psychromarinibacter sp. S121 TaxID=3415127 RepID=UPI003C7E3AB8